MVYEELTANKPNHSLYLVYKNVLFTCTSGDEIYWFANAKCHFDSKQSVFDFVLLEPFWTPDKHTESDLIYTVNFDTLQSNVRFII